jgi:hypothetical protein
MLFKKVRKGKGPRTCDRCGFPLAENEIYIKHKTKIKKSQIHSKEIYSYHKACWKIIRCEKI